MNKIYLLILVTTPLFGFSQDIITTTSGEKIEAKIKEIGEKTISYHKFNNLTGPLYTKDIKSIFQVKYENGEVEIYNKSTVLVADIKDISNANPVALLEKGNNVFIEIPDEASRAGEKYFIDEMKDWGYWNIVSSKEEAHFIIEFNIDKKAMLDKSVWVVFKTRDGKSFKESKHFRETTNAWNGYNAFKGAAKKVVEKYLVKEEFRH